MILDLVLIAGGTVFQSMEYDDKAIKWIGEQLWKKHEDETEKAEDDQQPYSANQVDMEGGSALKSFF
jgi:hypothetical protein